MFRIPVFALMIWAQIVTVDTTCDSELKNVLYQDILNMLMKMKGPSSAEPSTCNCKKIVIAFTASLSAAKSIGINEVVKFDKVWTNEGNGYHSNSGVFTAPKTGFYQISATIMSPNGKYFHSYLMKNNKQTVGMYPGQGHHTGAANIVLKLKKGDRVYIRHASNIESIYSDSNHYSMFSGFLISE
ncbi:heavy metal-binding protein HIP-like [Mytilus trossulus]|uniref:heavy metal-binding protein HIP-like n=1 Tax=Mytilus trossulus TaxID=6551 RepID=UPI00300684D2